MQSANEYPHIELDILHQPDETTCGPTCLHAVYRFYRDEVDLHRLIREVHKFEDGGTLAVWLGCHALKRGYEAKLYSCNLQLFDPTWFQKENVDIYKKLREQMHFKTDPKLRRASKAFMDFLKLGGQIQLEDLTRDLIRRFLQQGLPILTGLSSTFLYRAMREYGADQRPDDLRGEPQGHFVVLCGYNQETKEVLVADPYAQNPYSSSSKPGRPPLPSSVPAATAPNRSSSSAFPEGNGPPRSDRKLRLGFVSPSPDDGIGSQPGFKYVLPIDRVICAILLGILTYDANFLIIKPKS